VDAGEALSVAAPRAPATLGTERLLLRPVTLADAPAIFRYAADPLVTHHLVFATHRTMVEAVAFTQRCMHCWEDGSANPWAIVRRDGGDVIGTIELRLRPPRAEFGYALARAWWGRGYATEAARAVVAWAIEQPAIHRVWTTCAVDNAASARVLEKAGLVREGRLACWEARPNAGEAAGDSFVYALTRPRATA
jgi:ribosomal-protein-alanine N-acetyltransferase